MSAHTSRIVGTTSTADLPEASARNAIHAKSSRHRPSPGSPSMTNEANPSVASASSTRRACSYPRANAL